MNYSHVSSGWVVFRSYGVCSESSGLICLNLEYDRRGPGTGISINDVEFQHLNATEMREIYLDHFNADKTFHHDESER